MLSCTAALPLCGQDPERRQARRSAGRTTRKIRVAYQSENGQAARRDDLAQPAGAGGSSDQIERDPSRSLRVSNGR